MHNKNSFFRFHTKRSKKSGIPEIRGNAETIEHLRRCLGAFSPAVRDYTIKRINIQ